ncbi:MAG: cytochrome P460 family protein [Nitrospirae bacterium]|nr:cytochrome P460 family protein [Nitrospirota bacterium]
MKQIIIALFFFFVLFHTATYGDTAPAPNGINIPDGYRNWKVIAPSYRSDNNTIRVILGNDIAIKAAEKHETNPWPDGSVIAKIVWKAEKHEQWQSASVPGEFVHSEFMVKDSRKYPDTGGWGFARWTGMEQRPYGKDISFVQECLGCHTPVKDNDYMFTVPAKLP